jgi:hypothetical protein
MDPASIINFLSNDDTPPFRAESVIIRHTLAIFGSFKREAQQTPGQAEAICRPDFNFKKPPTA